ncbi:MAG TPA: 23S rRNA (guanosine(2251)-2'-O)-methyltransferase RlmB [Solirubrobacteraceae bacterium]|nr:23S rRNA (guanosine(2251)-2'-O)-methyltransferase RlmB [Solirubrobacteraceae bacterium]
MDRVYGKHSVRALLLARPQSVRRLLLAGREAYHRETIELARAAGVEPELVSWPELRRLGGVTDEDKHQGVVALTVPRPLRTEGELDELAKASVVLALDQISDPQNLGTILRSAAFFGADGVLVLKNRAAEVTPLVARIAVGGAELVATYTVTNLARSLQKLKGLGFWIYGLDERGERTLAQTAFDERSVIVVGAEGEGLRRRTRQECDALVRIPGGRPGVESLNAGVAVAVALAEIFRERGATDAGGQR